MTVSVSSRWLLREIVVMSYQIMLFPLATRCDGHFIDASSPLCNPVGLSQPFAPQFVPFLKNERMHMTNILLTLKTRQHVHMSNPPSICGLLHAQSVATADLHQQTTCACMLLCLGYPVLAFKLHSGPVHNGVKRLTRALATEFQNHLILSLKEHTVQLNSTIPKHSQYLYSHASPIRSTHFTPRVSCAVPPISLQETAHLCTKLIKNPISSSMQETSS